jgi:hypothetical protein
LSRVSARSRPSSASPSDRPRSCEEGAVAGEQIAARAAQRAVHRRLRAADREQHFERVDSPALGDPLLLRRREGVDHDRREQQPQRAHRRESDEPPPPRLPLQLPCPVDHAAAPFSAEHNKCW